MTKLVLGLLMLALPAALLAAANADLSTSRISPPQHQVSRNAVRNHSPPARPAQATPPADAAALAVKAPLLLLQVLVASTAVLDAAAVDGKCLVGPIAHRPCSILSH
jgi:hypothetical protein